MDADGPLAVKVMLLNEDYEEGGEDNATDEVKWVLWRDEKAEDNNNGKVEVEEKTAAVK